MELEPAEQQNLFFTKSRVIRDFVSTMRPEQFLCFDAAEPGENEIVPAVARSISQGQTKLFVN